MREGKLPCGDRSESTLYPRLPDFRKIVPRLRSPVRLLRTALGWVWNIGGIIPTGRKPNYWEKTLSHCHFVLHKSNTDWPEIDLGQARDRNWIASVICTAWTGLLLVTRTVQRTHHTCNHSTVLLLMQRFLQDTSWCKITLSLLQQSRVTVGRLTLPQIINNSPHFKEPDTSLRVHNSLPPVPILSKINPVHALSSIYFKLHFNIILPSTLRNSNATVPSDFPTKTLYTPLFKQLCIAASVV